MLLLSVLSWRIDDDDDDDDDIVERANKTEIRPKEQSEKTESCTENLWNEIQLKGHKDRNRRKSITRRNGQAELIMS